MNGEDGKEKGRQQGKLAHMRKSSRMEMASLHNMSVDHQGADYLHLDVMDGHFVPNLTFGHPVIKCIRSKVPNNTYVKQKNITFHWQVPKTTMLDLHMMVAQPQDWVQPCADAGGDMYTFHIGGLNTFEGSYASQNPAQRLPRNLEYCAGR